MKYLLSYKGFCRFVKEWEVLTEPPTDTVIQLQRGQGQIGSNPMTIDKDGVYQGEIYRIRGVSCLTAEVEPEPILINPVGTAGDSFTFSLPVKFHQIPQYHVHYMGQIDQCILVNDIVYNELRRIGLAK